MSAMWANGIKTDHLIDAFKDGLEDSFKCRTNTRSNDKIIIDKFYEDGYKFGELLQKKTMKKKNERKTQ